MKAGKTLLILLISLLSGTRLFAGGIPEPMARRIALNGCSEFLLLSNNGFIRENPVCIREGDKILCYAFNLTGDKGFILVAADDRITPILGFSDHGYFQLMDQPPAFAWFMKVLCRQINAVLTNDFPASEQVAREWQRLGQAGFSFSRPVSGVSPMVETTWDQGCYYNTGCPYDVTAINSCQHVYTGCGATSMAQILRFWGSPQHGVGSHSYNHPVYGILSANFAAATYNYASMPPELTSENADVAQLMYHCGVAQDMFYGATGSTSYSSDLEAAFKSYFDYHPDLQWKWRSSFAPAQWIPMLTTELDEGRPMIYYGNDNGSNGHYFICDGYQGTNFFHMNWGWGGAYDGYYYLTALNPGTNTFTDNQGAIFNLMPSQIPPPPPTGLTMDFETVPDFSLTFPPWTTVDVDSSATYGIQNHTFPHSGEAMAFICFNPAQVNPPLTDPAFQPHGGSRFGACFSATTPPNNDWFISPKVQLLNGGEFSFWVKSVTSEFGLERFRVGVSTTNTNPASFTIISTGSYLEAPTSWTKHTFTLQAYNNQEVYVGIQCVSDNAFAFMIDDLEVKRGDSSSLPSYMTLDFEGLTDFTLDFNPWLLVNINGGNTYSIQNVTFPHNGAPMAYICFNPSLTSPPLTNMTPHSGSRLGASFSNVPPQSQNNKWLISPHMSFGSNPSISLWVQTYHPDYPEKFNIGVSTTGSSPADFTIVNTQPEEAPATWTKRTFNLGAFANHDVFVGIQCVSYDAFIFMVDDIEISGNVGVDETVEEPVAVYPNPARDKVFVRFSGIPPRSPEIRLLDPMGGTVMKCRPEQPGTLTVVPTAGLRSGLYYLLIQYDEKTVVRKVTLLE